MDDDEVFPEDLLEEGYKWIFRGMFLHSPDDLWMKGEESIDPQDRTKRGRHWRDQHSKHDATETAYTAWSSNRDTAQMFAEEARDGTDASGEVVVFKVRIESLKNRCFRSGYENEDEILVEGVVDGIEISDGLEEEENG